MVHGTSTEAQSLPTPWSVDRVEHGLRLSGSFRTLHADEVLRAVHEATLGATKVELDLHNVEQVDSGVMLLILSDLSDRGIQVSIHDSDRFRPLVDLCVRGTPEPPRRRRAVELAEQLGRGTLQELAEFDSFFSFTGEIAVATVRLLRQPLRANWKAIPFFIEQTGMNALPIILILNFLVGFVMAYMGARALEMFGANIFVADLVAIAMTRQLGPLMTAIIVCGRSGAAFSAELGTMKVSEEIDALRTLGLDPMSWLVLPRMIALVLVLPVLTLLADLVGILGGLVVGLVSLDQSTKSYFNQTRGRLETWDVESGLWMSLAFAVAIGFIACQQGLATSGGAQGVGRRTTATVVHSLFAIVFLDALFTIFYRAVGLS